MKTISVLLSFGSRFRECDEQVVLFQKQVENKDVKAEFHALKEKVRANLDHFLNDASERLTGINDPYHADVLRLADIAQEPQTTYSYLLRLETGRAYYTIVAAVADEKTINLKNLLI